MIRLPDCRRPGQRSLAILFELAQEDRIQLFCRGFQLRLEILRAWIAELPCDCIRKAFAADCARKVNAILMKHGFFPARSDAYLGPPDSFFRGSMCNSDGDGFGTDLQFNRDVLVLSPGEICISSPAAAAFTAAFTSPLCSNRQ